MNSEQQRYKELGDFLKTRRVKILPSQVGILSSQRRRTPGLRREEVAQLAGISLTWYTWLEQGRPIQVTTSVVESLSRVLQLDREECHHFYRLANQPLPADIPKSRETVSPALQHMLDHLRYCPALITDQRWNVIAWNKASCTIFGDFDSMSDRERNIVWAMFTDSKYKELFVDWDRHAKGMVGRFRSTSGKYIEDYWFNQFIDELKTRSPEFNLWWPLHEIKNNGELYKQLNHPQVGQLDFEINNFDLADHSSLKMAVHVPMPGTDTAEKMASLLNALDKVGRIKRIF